MTKRRKYVVANWKMNPLAIEGAKKIFSETSRVASKNQRSVTVVVCPPAVYIDALTVRGRKAALVGAQNNFWGETGAQTGEVSAEMLAELGVDYVIVGHSERRALGETNEMVNKKLLATLEAGLIPVLCVGEQERDHHGEYLEFLRRQLKTALTRVDRKKLTKIIIAYEPVWAIGKTAEDAMSPLQVHEMVIFIRKVLNNLYDKKEAFAVPVLYGGSVEDGNDNALMAQGEVDGFLVGHASLDTKEFKSIIEAVANA